MDRGGFIDRIERMIETLLRREIYGLSGEPHWVPQVDIYEYPEHIEIIVELAGVQKEDIDLRYKNGDLIISGVRKEPVKPNRLRLYQMEMDYGFFYRKIHIDIPIDENKIKAKYENGLLFIYLPKSINANKKEE